MLMVAEMWPVKSEPETMAAPLCAFHRAVDAPAE